MEKDTGDKVDLNTLKFIWIDSLLKNNFILAESLALKQLYLCPDDPAPVLFLEMYNEKLKGKDFNETGFKTLQEEIKEHVLEKKVMEEQIAEKNGSLQENSDDSMDGYITPEDSSDEERETTIANLKFRRDLDQNHSEQAIRDMIAGDTKKLPEKKKAKKVSATSSKGFTKKSSEQRISYVNFDKKAATTKKDSKTTASKTTTKKV